MRPFLVGACLLLAACSRDLNNNAAVRQAIIDHLAQRKSLDLNVSQMDINVTAVAYRGSEADATVSFKVRGSNNPDAGMTMRYTLERKGNVWAVKAKGESSGGAHGPVPPSEMPPGHPPVERQGSGK